MQIQERLLQDQILMYPKLIGNCRKKRKQLLLFGIIAQKLKNQMPQINIQSRSSQSIEKTYRDKKYKLAKNLVTTHSHPFQENPWILPEIPSRE